MISSLLTKLRKRKVAIQVGEAAAALIQEAAERATPTETGGILLGWWENGMIVIDSAIEVIDKSATGTSWVRREAQAQTALVAALAESQNPHVGYVGDWHCHPAPVGASRTDLRSLARSSLQYENPLVLIVRLSDATLRVHAAERGRHLSVELCD
ncbi:Mov34/MPN/PAD-1 family protein [Mycolicibacterium goodii]|uniref:Mov34/MPN/PAD-1 family protein n=1 Tax=Mycolicibacterium goodii TaxID=134601 RepID=UPI001BDCE0F7|nr:Mov34/MPN/PAD-1 family protein [Mycolicibacterium goodii]MBU8830555.1 Mov34/MPN/PAD-1 family protein [Mycolicibacterium goodii]